MIVFDLACSDGHRFEGWFASSEDFSQQQQRGLVVCPQCGHQDVAKAPMAPAVPKKGNQASALSTKGEAVAGGKSSPELLESMKRLASAQAEMLKDSRWVGDKFVTESRAMHYGEKESQAIHGIASTQDAKTLNEEGISVAPLPFPVAPPDDIN